MNVAGYHHLCTFTFFQRCICFTSRLWRFLFVCLLRDRFSLLFRWNSFMKFLDILKMCTLFCSPELKYSKYASRVRIDGILILASSPSLVYVGNYLSFIPYPFSYISTSLKLTWTISVRLLCINPSLDSFLHGSNSVVQASCVEIYAVSKLYSFFRLATLLGASHEIVENLSRRQAESIWH